MYMKNENIHCVEKKLSTNFKSISSKIINFESIQIFYCNKILFLNIMYFFFFQSVFQYIFFIEVRRFKSNGFLSMETYNI